MKVSDDVMGGNPVHDGVGDASQRSPGEEPAAGSSEGLIPFLFCFVEDIVASANGLLEVQADRVRLSVKRTLVQGAIGAAVAVCAAFWLGSAALATVRGMCGGFTALWDGRTWLGDLTGGALALALVACVVAFYLRISSRQELERLKVKYERIRNKHAAEHDPATPAHDGNGAARPRGSAGEAAHRRDGAPAG